ncbi:MAG: DUF6492 family protein [Pyrinomonadaceae bacterium MAG19_C2-C3]|nr:DUF6492 family protein [Pyrinomonadaceae bacterium MAG19_C2-C3]
MTSKEAADDKSAIGSAVDVFIPVHRKDTATLGLCIRSLKKYLTPKPNRIVIVTSGIGDALQAKIERWGGCVLDESLVPDCPSLGRMPRIVVRGENRTGWYYQQFLKWAVRHVAVTPSYAVVDADTVLIHPIALMRGGKFMFHRGEQFHHPYFITFEKLFGYFPARQPSYIVNYMLLDCSIVGEIINRIEANGGHGKWYDKILAAIDCEEPSSFSEFETYGYYCSRYHPDLFESEEGRNLILPTTRRPFHRFYEMRFRRVFNSFSYHEYRFRN